MSGESKSVTIPAVRLCCETCGWHTVKWKGSSCEDQGYGADHDACANWLMDFRKGIPQVVSDVRLGLSSLSLQELVALQKFVKESIDHKVMKAPFTIGQRVKYVTDGRDGLVVNLSFDRSGQYCHIQCDDGVFIQAPMASFVESTEISEEQSPVED